MIQNKNYSKKKYQAGSSIKNDTMYVHSLKAPELAAYADSTKFFNMTKEGRKILDNPNINVKSKVFKPDQNLVNDTDWNYTENTVSHKNSGIVTSKSNAQKQRKGWETVNYSTKESPDKNISVSYPVYEEPVQPVKYIPPHKKFQGVPISDKSYQMSQDKENEINNLMLKQIQENRNLNPKYKNLEVKKHGGVIKKYQTGKPKNSEPVKIDKNMFDQWEEESIKEDGNYNMQDYLNEFGPGTPSNREPSDTSDIHDAPNTKEFIYNNPDIYPSTPGLIRYDDGNIGLSKEEKYRIDQYEKARRNKVRQEEKIDKEGYIDRWFGRYMNFWKDNKEYVPSPYYPGKPPLKFGGNIKKYQTAGTAGSLLTLTDPKKIDQYNKEVAIKNGTYTPSPTLANDNWKYKNSEARKSDYVQSKAKPNNVASQDNTKVNYQQAPIIYKTYPQNVNGKTVNVPTNQGTISQGNPDDFKDTLYNRSKNSKTFNNLANNLIVPVINIAGGLEGANLIKQGVKSIIKRMPKKVPLKVNDISNEIRLYNRNFNNNPTDNYKAIIDKGTNPIISKDIPDEPYPRMLYRKYTHGNPHDIHRFTLKNKPLNGNANNIIQKNNFKSDSGEDFFGRINKEHYPGIMKNYRKTAKRPIIINDEIPDMAYQRHIPRRTTKLSNKLGQDHSLQLKRNYPDDGIENNIEKYKFYKDLERYNIDISRINNIKNYLDKFDIIE